MRNTVAWMDKAEASLLANDWSETERCLRASYQAETEQEILRWRTILARLRLVQGHYDGGNQLLSDWFGEPFNPHTRALARLHESFYAARNWQTPHLTKPVVSLEASVYAYVESSFPEGAFLDLAHWDAWLLRYPAEIEDTRVTMRTLLKSPAFLGTRLLPSGLEALLAEAWYESLDPGLYPRMAAVEAAGIQKEFQVVMAYIRLLGALHKGDKCQAATSFDLLYSDVGVCLWLRRLPLLEEIGDKTRREHIVFQLDKADVWLETLIGVPILHSGYRTNVLHVGELSRQDTALSNRVREQWNARIGLESTV